MKHCVEKRDGFCVVGRRAVTEQSGGAWQLAREDGSIRQMEQMETGKPFLGLCVGFDERGRNDYMVGMEYAAPVEGLEHFEYPAARWLRYCLDGAISEDVLGNAWWYVKNELLAKLDEQQAELPTIESYVVWNDKENRCEVEILVPLKDK